MTDSAHDILARLPGLIREARTERGLTLEALAQVSGVSRSMASQIERGESSPTITTLVALAGALDLDLGALFAPPPREGRVEIVTADAAGQSEFDAQGLRIRDFGAGLRELRLGNGGSYTGEPGPGGAVLLAYVINGTVEVVSGGITAQADRGDVARLAADVPHGLRALDGGAKIVLARGT
ncbi:helix-turn-helix domain-containing protein [Mesobacterium pallidum]|uniref:helix-turn-helix domain-containing protein n=1 Tax=Mesobacterium pallidum TaxID=2872037 RepID=UPI001EE35339|nr:helix-turn-helix domain-containing protein [Mesobacterium pallidum]